MLDGFDERRIRTAEAEIFVRSGGSGPPLVCLHGYPQTHVTWRKVAPALAERYRVVLPDLRGYGASEIVASDSEHAAYSKRAMARDVVAVMSELGYDRFFVAGHDRGARVAYRLALDAPERVAAVAVLDIVPTLDTWEAMNAAAGFGAYHWFFLAQPHPLPERMIGADPDFYCEWTLTQWLADRSAMEPEALAAYIAAFRRTGAVHAACEDYRAGYTVDREADRADRAAGRRIAAPLLALWGAGPAGRRPATFGDAWNGWAADVTSKPLPCGHFLMEEAPAETAAELLAFFERHRAALT